MAASTEITHGSSEEKFNAAENEDSYGSSEGEADGGSLSGEGSVGGESEDEVEESGNPNAGWAEAMAKVLHKTTPENKPTILTKNKKLEKMKEKEKQEKLERKKELDKKKAWEMMCRVKPDVVRDRETERNLQRIATRGVVQLFNAVRKHQKNMDEKVKEAGGSERKRAKLLSSVSKKDFINVLRGTETGTSQTVSKLEKSKKSGIKTEDKPSWSILRDDFMMGAAMKDWDKESEEEN
ncbi:RRP15-like protein [Lepisosteus oculatus]|uniref:RRP15-like protein n=1 Tax=Lepisosteus oculatus TaxID=7918 RepID=UPI0003EA9E17|nr:PREDICTED: RRP15-like protein isoform X1 [Lepisosteus oculatus]